MPMSAYEPGSGWNLPPGCREGDPSAPWNGRDPWEGMTCGGCARCARCRLLDGGSVMVCATGSGDLEEIDPDAPACEGFEDC